MVVLICISLMISDVEHLFMYLSAISYFRILDAINSYATIEFSAVFVELSL